MEGYSVTEAASVLGVPTERVWELLARGVLSGTPDGGTGMRVFLQPRPAPPAVDDQPRRPDGRGDTQAGGVETSPFRELLTEFRNLTERYGQALLALGEARGEVAALRSRVDLLEARMDLRLPVSSSLSQEATWPAFAAEASAAQASPLPAGDEAQPAPAAEAHRAAASAAEPPAAATPVEPAMPAAAPEPPQKSERGASPGTDPTPARRRGRPQFSDGFAEALARAADPSPAVLRGGAESGAALAGLRSESPSSEDQPSSEPDTDAGLPRELPAAEQIAVEEPVPSATPVLGRDVEATTEDVDHTTGDTAQASPDAAAPEPASPQRLGPEPDRPAVAARPMEPEVRAEPTWDQERYTAQIAEPDWWMPEESFWTAPEPSPGGGEVVPAAGPTEDSSGETEAIRAGRRGLAPLPGGEELQEALASLGAAGGLPDGGTSPPEATDAPESQPGAASAAAPTDEGHSPAARAYRRLRRIFPG